MQTWIRANIGKLITRMVTAETTITGLVENALELSAKTNFITNTVNHNAIFGGRDLTNVYTIDEMYDMIHSGNFDDLYVGDYFTVSITTDIYTHFVGETFESGVTYYEMSGTINDRVWTETDDETPQNDKTYATKLTKTENVDLMFAAFDYYYNMGDTALTTHHAILIPKTNFATLAKMNPTNTSVGGYYNCDMHQIVLPCYAKSIKTALNGHLITHRTWLTTDNNTSTWFDTELQLMSELQVYGCFTRSSGALETGIDNEKLPVFNFVNPVQYNRNSVWLRSVVSPTIFSAFSLYGLSTGAGASTAYYVRPLILFG